MKFLLVNTIDAPDFASQLKSYLQNEKVQERCAISVFLDKPSKNIFLVLEKDAGSKLQLQELYGLSDLIEFHLFPIHGGFILRTFDPIEQCDPEVLILLEKIKPALRFACEDMPHSLTKRESSGLENTLNQQNVSTEAQFAAHLRQYPGLFVNRAREKAQREAQFESSLVNIQQQVPKILFNVRDMNIDRIKTSSKDLGDFGQILLVNEHTGDVYLIHRSYGDNEFLRLQQVLENKLNAPFICFCFHSSWDAGGGFLTSPIGNQSAFARSVAQHLDTSIKLARGYGNESHYRPFYGNFPKPATVEVTHENPAPRMCTLL